MLPEEVKEIVGNADYFFLDVRSQEEWDYTHLAFFKLIPLDELELRLSEIPKDKKIICMCRSGVRSQYAADILIREGYEAFNLEGGILAMGQFFKVIPY